MLSLKTMDLLKSSKNNQPLLQAESANTLSEEAETHNKWTQPHTQTERIFALLEARFTPALFHVVIITFAFQEHKLYVLLCFSEGV